MNNLQFHKISEKEKKEIQKKAKEIIQNFSKQLDSVKEKVKEISKKISNETRKEGITCGEIDKKIMFENAPKKNKDFIIGDTKKW